MRAVKFFLLVVVVSLLPYGGLKWRPSGASAAPSPTVTWNSPAITQQMPFITFTEGNPGVPGDEITISAAGGLGGDLVFEPSPHFPLGGTTNGLTFTMFPEFGIQISSLFFTVSNDKVPTDPCFTGILWQVPLIGEVSFNGVRGFYFSLTQSQVEAIVAFANQDTPGCDFTLNDLRINTIYMFDNMRQSITTLDAFAISRSEVAVARDIKCHTFCSRSPQYFLLNLTPLPPGLGIEIGGVNFNVPTRNLTAIKLALEGGSTLHQQLNQQFVATQMSLIRAGGHSSPQIFSARQSPLSCYGLIFQPITLSNGVILTPDSMLGDLFQQANIAMRSSRSPRLDLDLFVLKTLFSRLNGNDTLGRCHTPDVDVLFVMVCITCSEGTACASSEGGFVSTSGGATAGGSVVTHTGAGTSRVIFANGCDITAETSSNGGASVIASGCSNCIKF